MKVAILQHRLLHYRKDLFNRLRHLCLEGGIDFSLLHGDPSRFESTRSDTCELVWTTKVKNIHCRLGSTDLLLQLVGLKKIIEPDLVVLMQENRILSNYFIIAVRSLIKKKTAFWGHGRNMQSRAPNGIREKWKNIWINSVDWWFCYTSGTLEYVVSMGFPTVNSSVLNNAIDVHSLRSDLSSVDHVELDLLRNELGILATDCVGVFCGSIYQDKKIDLLIDACDELVCRLPSFKLIVIGAGPYQAVIEEAAASRSWLHYVGPLRGRDKAVYYKLGQVMLNPGLVGLHILDSFAAGLPMVTTQDALHSPEYDYLVHGQNGIVVDGGAEEYADNLFQLFTEPERLNKYSRECITSSLDYTVEAMAQNFHEGIKKCLAS